MALAELYVDESGSHQGSPALVVGGHIYYQNAAQSFAKAWSEYLASKNLPFFRMTDCALRQGPFKGRTTEECLEIEIELIRLVKERTERAIAVVLNEDEFRAYGPQDSRIGSPYAFCLRVCLSHVFVWMKDRRFKGKVTYFFESGHRNQSDANRIMNDIFADPMLCKMFHYEKHAFADKKIAHPLQGADLVAWQWYTATKHRLAGKKTIRKDFQALIRPQDMAIVWTPENLRGLTSYLKTKEGERLAQSGLLDFPADEILDQTPTDLVHPQSPEPS